VPDVAPAVRSGEQADLFDDTRLAIAEFTTEMEAFRFHKAIAAIWLLISKMNKYVVTTAPWELAKEEHTAERLADVIFNLLEGLRVIAGLVLPLMPKTSLTMQRHLGIDDENTLSDLAQINQWGSILPGTCIPKPVSLFPRIEPEKHKDAPKSPDKPASTEPKALLKFKPEISFDDVLKIDLRVATVIRAEKVPKANKLLKLEIEIGEEKRTIVAGIAKSYSPDQIIGKQVIVVANLKPATLMGVASQGMLLAAVSDDATVVATIDHAVASGIPVK